MNQKNHSKIEIVKLTEDKIITQETEYKDDKIYMRAKIRRLHNKRIA